ncbi:MAG: hypothetical protein IT494_03735 [Gammaproteobacteria bacterium]|nr:hypothetical protein [Gammaproteobacteria bacterium]
MNNRAKRILGVIGCAAFAAQLSAQPKPLPEPLRGWEDWVLDGAEYRRCPLRAGRDGSDTDDFVCVWPGRLELSLDAAGGTFRQTWRVFRTSWVGVPGDEKIWPATVMVAGAPAPIVARDGRPLLRLVPGTHEVTGTLAWQTRPRELRIPSATALLSLTLDGAVIAHPIIDGNQVRLGEQSSLAEPPTLELTVHRLLADTVPAELETRIRLRVGGAAREELLALPLLAGFTPLAITSELATQIEPGGGLRVRVRAGNWEIGLRARSSDIAREFTIEPPSQERGTWVNEEIWSFAAQDRLRIAAVEGVVSINPEQAQVPGDWQELPAFLVTPGSTLRVVERSRGLPADNDNVLQLRRDLWLDFDHRGYTIVDHVTGTMRDGWRLELAAPYRLQSARVDGEPLLITRTDAEHSGVELRDSQVNLQATARLEAFGGWHAASGWNERFRALDGTLHLPPGHHLLAALGVESSPDAWISRWDLFDIFLVLITTVAVARLCGWRWGTLAALALVLNYQEPYAANWLWLNAVIALALARLVGSGWLGRCVFVYRLLAIASLVIWFVAFAVMQVRVALYPQLEVARASMVSASMRAAAAPDAQLEQQVPRMMVSKRLETAGRAAAVFREQKREAGDNISVTGSSVRQERYAPGTTIQAGPGMPNWDYLRYRLQWHGPVSPDNDLRFIVFGRFAVSLWQIVGVALAALLLIGIVPRRGWSLRVTPAVATTATALCLIALLLPAPVTAQAPDPKLLEDLRARLVRPPECAPTCAEIQQAKVTTTSDTLAIDLTVNALTEVAIAMPAAPGRWRIDAVLLDETTPATLRRDGNQNFIDLPAGVHRVRLRGALLAADSIQVVFPSAPRAISASGSGWIASGIDGGRLPTGTLELARQGGTGERIEVSVQVPPFVAVRRAIDLGLDWSVTTTITRIAPQRGAFTLEVPLLPGEAVLDANATIRQGKLVAAFGPDQRVLKTASALPRSDELQLTHAADVPWREVWAIAVGDTWRVKFSGLPPVAPENEQGRWLHEYHPRGGETLVATVTQPDAIPGTMLAIDRVVLKVEKGRRATNHELLLWYRATQGGRQTLTLPEQARVTSVRLDGDELAIRPERGVLPVNVVPGEHQVAVTFEDDVGVSSRVQSPAIDLGTTAANVGIIVTLPDDRWLLYAGGGGVAPVVLYWGELAVFIIVAIALGRITRTPLRPHEWLLLGLGLSTFAWATLALFAAWIFALRWRENWLGTASRWKHGLIQGALVVLSVATLGALIAAIPQGLLAQPDMSVRSTDSWRGQLHWFFDQSSGPLPRVSAISLSLWWYRAAMLAWALWLAFALLRWLPWAWRAFLGQTQVMSVTEHSPA